MDGRRAAGALTGPGTLVRTVAPDVAGVVIPELPARHGFVVAAGLETALHIVELRAYHGDVWAVPEGTLLFADEPMVQLRGPAPETERLAAAMAETLGVQAAAATATARMTLAAHGRPVIDASSRSGPGGGARQRARGAVVGGATHTSNNWAAARFGIPAIEAAKPHEAFPDVLGAMITADDLDDAEVARLVHEGAPVAACAVGAHVADDGLDAERCQHEPASTAAGLGAVVGCAVELYRYPASNGDVVQPRCEPAVDFARPLLELVMSSGLRTGHRATMADARARCAEALALLPPEVRDLTAPEPVRVTWAERLWRTRIDAA
jgi:hypothetical protein